MTVRGPYLQIRRLRRSPLPISPLQQLLHAFRSSYRFPRKLLGRHHSPFRGYASKRRLRNSHWTVHGKWQLITSCTMKQLSWRVWANDVQGLLSAPSSSCQQADHLINAHFLTMVVQTLLTVPRHSRRGTAVRAVSEKDPVDRMGAAL